MPLATFMRMTRSGLTRQSRAGLVVLGLPNMAVVRDIDRGKHANLSC
jgi:hypothetical protein